MGDVFRVKNVPEFHVPEIDTNKKSAGTEAHADAQRVKPSLGKQNDAFFAGAMAKHRINQAAPRTPPAAPAAAQPEAGMQAKVTVGGTDTLQDLANQYGVSMSEIIRANPGKEAQLQNSQQTPYNSRADINYTMEGQQLNIPRPESFGDRMKDAVVDLHVTSKGDHELSEMNETAKHIASNDLSNQPGPAAKWTEQQRLNFARGRMEMQEGKTLSQALGQFGALHTTTDFLGEQALSKVGLEFMGGATAVGLGIEFVGDLGVDKLKNTMDKAGDYKLAGDVEYLRTLAQGPGVNPLDARKLVDDQQFIGSHGLITGVTPEEHVAAALALYHATFDQ